MKKIIFILIVTILASCKSEPKTLSEKIIQNIENHPHSWHVQQTGGWLSSNDFPIFDEARILVNDSCNIKLEVYKPFSLAGRGTYVRMISPDTLEFYNNEGEAIVSAYVEYVQEPLEKRNETRKDSIEAISLVNHEKQKQLVESKILDQLCKH